MAHAVSVYHWNRFDASDAKTHPPNLFKAIVVTETSGFHDKPQRYATMGSRRSDPNLPGWWTPEGFIQDGDPEEKVIAYANAPEIAQSGPIPDCHCTPGQCAAPLIMGAQARCINPEKAANTV